ncbi:MAG: hypothetical protein Q8P01_02415 [bacterium]|nr:hypothetical protein [bacterium]
MTFEEAVQVFTPLFKEFAGCLPLEGSENGSYRCVRALVGKDPNMVLLVLYQASTIPLRLSACPFSGPRDVWPAWKLFLPVKSRDVVVEFAPDPAGPHPQQHLINPSSALLLHLLSHALRLLGGVLEFQVNAEDDETEIAPSHGSGVDEDDDVPEHGFLGPDGHTRAFIM